MTLKRYDLSPRDLHDIQEHLPVGDYFTINPDGQSITLHDIVTHEPLQGTETPPGILAEASLRRGLDFLHTEGRSGRLAVQLVLAPHGSADDFARIRAEYGQVLDAASIIALEMSSLAQQPQLNSHPGRRAFQQAELDWTRAEHKVILPCELAMDDTSPLAECFKHVWNNIYQPTLRDTTLAPGVRNAAALIAEAAYQRARQPAIVARMGFLLSELALKHQGSAGYGSVPLVLGSWHRHDAQRLDALGVPNEVWETTATPPYGHEVWEAFGTIIMHMTYTSTATLAELSVVPPYLEID